MRPVHSALLLVAAAALAAPAVHGALPEPPTIGVSKKPKGRPKVRLDHLEFPKSVRGWPTYKKFLRRVLEREARRADWGAGRGARIEYRFFVEKLEIKELDGVLRVSCTAIGRLPKGKAAKSTLSFGGPPHKRADNVRSVLQIVARGVMTRLAELERVRRGDLSPSRVRRPKS